MNRQIRETSPYAIAALLLAMLCYVQFLGIEKAVVALSFAVLAIREAHLTGKKGKSLAYIAIILTIIFILFLILYIQASSIII